MILHRKFLDDGSMWRSAPLSIGVAGNHLVDEVVFDVPEAYRSFLLFIKIDGEQPNKLPLTLTEGGFLWAVRRGQLTDMGGNVCQLQAEKQDGSEIVVWQSKPFTVYADKHIDADAALSDAYTPYLQELDARVAANADRAERAADRAEQAGGGGSIGDVNIEDVDGLQTALDGKADAQTLSEHISDQANPHGTTAQEVGAAEALHDHEITEVQGLQSALNEKADAESLQNHVSDSANPHGVSAEQTGAAALTHGHAMKDIDGLQDSLDVKATSAALLAHVEGAENPHNVTPSQIGAADANHTHTPSDVEGLTDQLNNAERFAALLNGWVGDESTPIAASAFSLDTVTGEVFSTGNTAVEFVVNPQTGELIQIGEAAGVAFRVANGYLEVLTNAE